MKDNCKFNQQGLCIRHNHELLESKVCPECQEPFKCSKSQWKKVYCSDECQRINERRNKKINRRKEEIIDEWIACWVTRRFPTDRIPNDFTSWRRFRDFWLVYYDYSLLEAFNVYTQKRNAGGR